MLVPLTLLVTITGTVLGQQRGKLNNETHPTLQIQKCTKAAGCTIVNAKVVLNANWRWLHSADSTASPCLSNNAWSTQYCPDPTTCGANCALDGASYSDYGITVSGGSLTQLMFPPVTGSEGTRVHLLADDEHYMLFNLRNQELTFDVDVSGLPCGTNGALYLTSMPSDGGTGAFPANKAGAFMGTGYCDAACPQDVKFINGQANSIGWTPSSKKGTYGNCCHEMDIWESNAVSTAMTAHTCNTYGPHRCTSSNGECGNVCDHDGCDFNPYRLGNKTFYGPGGTVNTGPGPMRVITQFITTDGTATGNLSEIRRAYIRNGKVINNWTPTTPTLNSAALQDNFCANEAKYFGAVNTFKSYGGMQGVASAMSLGMVLTMSAWIDYDHKMQWLDSAFPPGANTASPGVLRGTCPTSAGDVNALKSQYPNAQVKFSNIKFGDINTSYGPPYP